MPSNRVKDSTDIYRFKVTRKGTTKIYRSGFWQYDGNHEEVEFIGFYTSKYKFEPWVPKVGSLKIEHQKLEIETFGSTAPRLEWTTISTKSWFEGERND
jgi:hypothetical protein